MLLLVQYMLSNCIFHLQKSHLCSCSGSKFCSHLPLTFRTIFTQSVKGNRMWSVLCFIACISVVCSKTTLPRQWFPSRLNRGGSTDDSFSSQVPLVTSPVGGNPSKTTKPSSHKDQEQLYEAYNMLHSLAQVRTM
jgi:hypothetical protein